ncbi:MAG: alpha/beta hydrolase, partial [Rhodospirillales bacterium]|nr:alpha/beta hydrolase [Rhodospirillales bacterium]
QVEMAGAAIDEAARAMGLAEAPMLAFDLAATLVLGRAGAVLAVDAARARGWAERGTAPAELTPRGDGTHLTALWAHLRDAHVLDPADPTRAAQSGAALPTAAELDATLVVCAARPGAYHALWRACLTQAATLAGPATLPDAITRLRALPGPARADIPLTPPGHEAWCDHADLPHGRAHLWRAGTTGRALFALHSAPGSAAPLGPLLHGLARGRRVVAPDYLGNGRSSKPARPVDINRLARDVLDLADVLGFDDFDLWGTHTGALIALETALIAPERVGRLVLEAPPLLPPAFTADILANYLPKLRPDGWGLHVQQAWNMRRDMFLFWPWYRAERSAVRPLQLPDAAFLHAWTIGLLQSGTTYDLSYRAAFEYDTQRRLPLLRRPALVCAGPSDMLADGLAKAKSLAPDHVTVATTPATVWYPNQTRRDVEATLRIYDEVRAADRP